MVFFSTLFALLQFLYLDSRSRCLHTAQPPSTSQHHLTTPLPSESVKNEQIPHPVIKGKPGHWLLRVKGDEKNLYFGLLRLVVADHLSVASVGFHQVLVVPRLLDLSILQQHDVVAEFQILEDESINKRKAESPLQTKARMQRNLWGLSGSSHYDPAGSQIIIPWSASE